MKFIWRDLPSVLSTAILYTYRGYSMFLWPSDKHGVYFVHPVEVHNIGHAYEILIFHKLHWYDEAPLHAELSLAISVGDPSKIELPLKPVRSIAYLDMRSTFFYDSLRLSFGPNTRLINDSRGLTVAGASRQFKFTHILRINNRRIFFRPIKSSIALKNRASETLFVFPRRLMWDLKESLNGNNPLVSLLSKFDPVLRHDAFFSLGDRVERLCSIFETFYSP